MPRRFIHLAFFLFFITAISGLWLRLFPFLNNTVLPYDHILHGHSHIAVLGWAFLGIYIIFIKLLWPSLKEKKHASLLASVIFIVSLIMFFTFLYEGYASYSIIMSTVHIFVEYWAIIFIYRRLKDHREIPAISQLFIKGALISLFLSTLGPFALGYLGATGLKESALFEMSIYFFLHFQYNGFLTLFLIGLLLMILHRANINFSASLVEKGFWIYFLSLIPWYISSILWADLGSFAKIIASLGSIMQFIAIVIILLSIRSSFVMIRKNFNPIITFGLTVTFFLFLVKGSMELGLIFPGLSELVFDTRSVIVGYLHLTLLGFISLLIILQFQMVDMIDVKNKLSLFGTSIFLTGFILNELILFFQGLSAWTGKFTLPKSSELLVLASILLLSGIISYWSTLSKNETN